MPTFRKKPVEIEAFQLEKQEDPSRYDQIWPDWFKAAWKQDPEKPGSAWPCGDGIHAIEISTLEGNHKAFWGDWIIRGVKGELYPCKPDIFEATYDAT